MLHTLPLASLLGSGEPGAMVSSTLKLGISILNGGNSDVQQVKTLNSHIFVVTPSVMEAEAGSLMAGVESRLLRTTLPGLAVPGSSSYSWKTWTRWLRRGSRDLG